MMGSTVVAPLRCPAGANPRHDRALQLCTVPEYVGFILVIFGFLLQWPTMLTVAMFPVLTVMYVRLARTEEQDARREFGDAYVKYATEVPGFVPTPSRILGQESSGGHRRG